jgi:hypothetical protein
MSDAKDAQALEGRRRGLPLGAIAAALGCSVEEAEAAIARALAEAPPELDPEAALILDLSRIDRMIQGVWKRATEGEPAAVDRMIRLIEMGERLRGEPARVKDALSDALTVTLDALDLETEDAAIVAACQQVARQIDHAIAHGTSMEATKAMYLLPHLWNGLRELGATPAARAALKASVPTPPPVPVAADPQEVPVDLDTFKKQRRGGA